MVVVTLATGAASEAPEPTRATPSPMTAGAGGASEDRTPAAGAADRTTTVVTVEVGHRPGATGTDEATAAVATPATHDPMTPGARAASAARTAEVGAAEGEETTPAAAEAGPTPTSVRSGRSRDRAPAVGAAGVAAIPARPGT